MTLFGLSLFFDSPSVDVDRILIGESYFHYGILHHRSSIIIAIVVVVVVVRALIIARRGLTLIVF